ncbi:unnamed protein product [Arctogadus glacialis]
MKGVPSVRTWDKELPFKDFIHGIMKVDKSHIISILLPRVIILNGLNCSTKHKPTTPRLSGSRQNGCTSGSQQKHLGYTIMLKTPHTFLTSTCPESSGQPSTA